MIFRQLFESDSSTYTYLVGCSDSGKALLIDPVLDTVERDLQVLRDLDMTLTMTLETHIHADHLTGAQYIKSRIGGTVAIGEGIRQVQAHFGPVFNLGKDFASDGHQFDRLFSDGDTFTIGGLECEVIATPGHTNDSVSYRIGSAVFVGDSMFMPDFGTARCDFPGGDAGLLYDSIQRILSLPGDTQLYMCHDYMPGGRELRWVCTVDEQRSENIHVNADVDKAGFVKMRQERDAELRLPGLIVPSIQVNIRAGHLPDAESNGIAYLKTPIDTL